MAVGHIQVNQQTGHRLGAHGGATISVQRERTRHHIVTSHGIGNKLLGQFSAFARRNQPAHDVATEDVQDDVQVKASLLGRAFELGDVPRPDLAALTTAIGAAGVGSQLTVPGAHRPQVAALIEQSGVYRR